MLYLKKTSKKLGNTRENQKQILHNQEFNPVFLFNLKRFSPICNPYESNKSTYINPFCVTTLFKSKLYDVCNYPN